MAVEHQRARSGRSNFRDDIRPPRRRFDEFDAKSPCVEDVRQRLRDLRLAWAARDKRRIPRIDSYELARQRNGVASLYAHRSTPSRASVNGNTSPSVSTDFRTA